MFITKTFNKCNCSNRFSTSQCSKQDLEQIPEPVGMRDTSLNLQSEKITLDSKYFSYLHIFVQGQDISSA